MKKFLSTLKSWLVYFSAGIFMFFSWYGECAMKTEGQNRYQHVETIYKTEGK